MTNSEATSGKKLFFGLFIFPLLIAVGMAVFLCTVVLLTHEEETPETLLVSLKKSSPGKRWQKAFELSNEINRHPQTMENESLRREMVQILMDAEHFDEKTRGYMALALSHRDSDETLEALREILKEPGDELKGYSLWAIGLLRRKEAAPDVEALLNSDSADVRKIAVYVLGVIDSKSSVPKLESSLNDPSADVRWNAALALARLGNAQGYPVLVSMLERETLSSQAGLGEAQIEAVMVNATKGLALIQKPESIKILQSLSRRDKNLKVRQAAMNALQNLEKIST
mgnify:FL=1